MTNGELTNKEWQSQFGGKKNRVARLAYLDQSQEFHPEDPEKFGVSDSARIVAAKAKARLNQAVFSSDVPVKTGSPDGVRKRNVEVHIPSGLEMVFGAKPKLKSSQTILNNSAILSQMEDNDNQRHEYLIKLRRKYANDPNVSPFEVTEFVTNMSDDEISSALSKW